MSKTKQNKISSLEPKTGNNPNVPQQENLKNCVFIQRSKCLVPSVAWANLTDTMPSWTQRSTYYVIPFILSSRTGKTNLQLTFMHFNISQVFQIQLHLNCKKCKLVGLKTWTKTTHTHRETCTHEGWRIHAGGAHTDISMLSKPPSRIPSKADRGKPFLTSALPLGSPAQWLVWN